MYFPFSYSELFLCGRRDRRSKSKSKSRSASPAKVKFREGELRVKDEPLDKVKKTVGDFIHLSSGKRTIKYMGKSVI